MPIIHYTSVDVNFNMSSYIFTCQEQQKITLDTVENIHIIITIKHSVCCVLVIYNDFGAI